MYVDSPVFSISFPVKIEVAVLDEDLSRFDGPFCGLQVIGHLLRLDHAFLVLKDNMSLGNGIFRRIVENGAIGSETAGALNDLYLAFEGVDVLLAVVSQFSCGNVYGTGRLLRLAAICPCTRNGKEKGQDEEQKKKTTLFH